VSKFDRGLMFLLVLAVFGAVFVQSRLARDALVRSERANCQRSIGDRALTAASWYSAYRTNRARSDTTANATLRARYAASAQTYFQTAWALNQHVDPQHSVRVGHTYPLGVGHLSCVKTFPYH
jgi:hypothetical protein